MKTLGEAAGDDDLLFLASGVFLTSIDGLDDSADGFILGDIDERAGVDDECIGELGVRDKRHAFGLQMAKHDFRVDEVLGTAKGDESNLGRHNVRAVISRDWAIWKA